MGIDHSRPSASSFPSSWTELLDWCDEATELSKLLDDGSRRGCNRGSGTETPSFAEKGKGEEDDAEQDAIKKNGDKERGKIRADDGEKNNKEDLECAQGREIRTDDSSSSPPPSAWAYKRFVLMVHRDLVVTSRRGRGDGSKRKKKHGNLRGSNSDSRTGGELDDSHKQPSPCPQCIASASRRHRGSPLVSASEVGCDIRGGGSSPDRSPVLSSLLDNEEGEQKKESTAEPSDDLLCTSAMKGRRCKHGHMAVVSVDKPSPTMRLPDVPELSRWVFETVYKRKVFVLVETPSNHWQERYGVPATTVYRTMPFVQPPPCQFLTVSEFASVLTLLRGLQHSLVTGSQLSSSPHGIDLIPKRCIRVRGERRKTEQEASDDVGYDDGKQSPPSEQTSTLFSDCLEKHDEDAPAIVRLRTRGTTPSKDELRDTSAGIKEVKDDDDDDGDRDHPSEEEEKEEWLAQKRDHEREVECIICMDEYTQVVLPCAHAFCARCSHLWFKERRECPVCRGEVSEGAHSGREIEEEEWQLETWSTKDIADHVKDIETRLSHLSCRVNRKTSTRKSFSRSFEEFQQVTTTLVSSSSSSHAIHEHGREQRCR